MNLFVETTSVAKAWMETMQRVFFEGDVIHTDYDTGDDFPSRDVFGVICMTDPFSDPYNIRGQVRKVKCNVTGKEYVVYCHRSDTYCIEAIKSGYLSEVMSGEMDHLIWSDGDQKSYPYTYHDRLFSWVPINKEALRIEGIEDMEIDGMNAKEYIENLLNNILEKFKPVNQIEEIVKKLSKKKGSKYWGISRRAQATTWRPFGDNVRSDPPCLQRIWMRMYDGELRMHTHWRSRDLFGAWEANVNGMLEIGKEVAKKLGVKFTAYNDVSDSLHIYGKKKKLYKELTPLLETVRNREGLFKPEYNELLDKWIEEAKEYNS